MKNVLTLVIFGSISACGGPAESGPTFEQTKTAVVAHARCIDDTVKTLDASSGTLDEQMQFVRNECSRERVTALKLQAVPIFEPTVAQYDEMQNDLASGLIASKRSEEPE